MTNAELRNMISKIILMLVMLSLTASADWSKETKHRHSLVKNIIAKEAKRFGVPNERLTALLYTESRFKRYARSRTGSYGIAQFTRTKAREMGVNRTNLRSSIRGAAKLLKKNFDNSIKSFTDAQRWNLATIYYNRGKAYHFKAKEALRKRGVKITYHNLIKQYNKYSFMDEGMVYYQRINKVEKYLLEKR